jgi:hypothetical protein
VVLGSAAAIHPSIHPYLIHQSISSMNTVAHPPTQYVVGHEESAFGSSESVEQSVRPAICTSLPACSIEETELLTYSQRPSLQQQLVSKMRWVMRTALVPDGLHHSGAVGVRIQHQQMGGLGGDSCSSSERDTSTLRQEEVVEVHLL